MNFPQRPAAMPHRVLNVLSARLPKAIVSLDNLAAALKLTRLKAKRLDIKAHRAELVIWWAETNSVVMAPDEAARLGYELYSFDSPDPRPKDWRWVKIGTTPKQFPDFEASAGSDPDEPDRMDQFTVMDPAGDPDGMATARWLAHPGTTSPHAQHADEPKPKRRGRKGIWGDYGDSPSVGFAEAKSILITPRVNVQEGAASWSPAVEVVGKPGCILCNAGAKLKGLEFCLACCRFGLDHLLPVLKPSDMPKDTKPIDDDGLAGGKGKTKKAVAA